MSHFFYPEQFSEIFFRNLLDADSGLRLFNANTRTGYPVDIFFENLQMENDSGKTTLNFQFALPGVLPTDVKITRTNDGELRVRYDKPKSNESRDYISKSISSKSFDLSWKISGKFDLSKLESTWLNGLLTISIPQSVESLPEQVEIKLLS